MFGVGGFDVGVGLSCSFCHEAWPREGASDAIGRRGGVLLYVSRFLVRLICGGTASASQPGEEISSKGLDCAVRLKKLKGLRCWKTNDGWWWVCRSRK